MNKLLKLLTELVIISYANMMFNGIQARTVVATLAKSAGVKETYDKEIDNMDRLIDEYAKKLHEDIGV